MEERHKTRHDLMQNTHKTSKKVSLKGNIAQHDYMDIKEIKNGIKVGCKAVKNAKTTYVSRGTI